MIDEDTLLHSVVSKHFVKLFTCVHGRQRSRGHGMKCSSRPSFVGCLAVGATVKTNEGKTEAFRRGRSDSNSELGDPICWRAPLHYVSLCR